MTTLSEPIRCQRCGLPFPFRQVSLVPRIVHADDDGLCSFCAFHRESPVDLFDHERYRSLFEERLARVRGKYEYDALVGISGGKDGAYVLHRLTRHYGLRVLAFTFDNGFLNPTATDKIRELAAIYGVDHLFYHPTHLTALYRAIIRQAAVPCHACAMGGYYVALAIQLKERIPLFVHGRSPYQMLRNLDRSAFDDDPYFALIRSNLDAYDSTRLASAYARMYEGIVQSLDHLALNAEERLGILDEFFSPLAKMTEDFVPESFAYFLTEHYDEATIRSALLEEAGYACLSSHDDCLIHNAANYLTARQYGVSVHAMETATMLRVGHASESMVHPILQKESPERLRRQSVVDEELQLMCHTLDLTQADVAVWPTLS
ncbi:MAG TPA: hypothetical protein VIV60_17915 [Polyangiaceae bacterium]